MGHYQFFFAAYYVYLAGAWGLISLALSYYFGAYFLSF
jgi:hypothetical protein